MPLLQEMIYSKDTTPDPRKTTTENLVKELLDALAEIMDKKVHLENENVELRHKCLSQKQKIEAFKELALGEKAFLLGIIKKECTCSASASPVERKDEYPVKEEPDGNLKVDKIVSSTIADQDDGCLEEPAERENEVEIEKKISRNSAGKERHECCNACPARRDSGDVETEIKSHDQQNQTEQLTEIKNLQKLMHQYFEGAKNREERLLSIMQQLEQQMRVLHKRCDCMQNKLNEMQVEQKTIKPKSRSKESNDRNSLKSQEKESQTDNKANKKLCKCGGMMSQKEEEILSELFFQRF